MKLAYNDLHNYGSTNFLPFLISVKLQAINLVHDQGLVALVGRKLIWGYVSIMLSNIWNEFGQMRSWYSVICSLRSCTSKDKLSLSTKFQSYTDEFPLSLWQPKDRYERFSTKSSSEIHHTVTLVWHFHSQIVDTQIHINIMTIEERRDPW